MAERRGDLRRQRRLPVRSLVESESQSEVLEFNVAVQRIASRVLELLKDKPVVTALVFGYPNAGKSELANQVLARVEAQLGHRVSGGEMKGYDEKPSTFGQDPQEVYFIQQVTYPLAGEDPLQSALQQEATAAQMPQADFTVVITNPAINKFTPEQFVGMVDYVIRNSASRKK